MLDAYIIEQIRKRDEEGRRVRERPALRIPLQPPPRRAPEEEEREAPRVIIIDL